MYMLGCACVLLWCVHEYMCMFCVLNHTELDDMFITVDEK